MIHWESCVMATISVLITYMGIKIIDRLFERTDNKKKNSLF